MEGAPEEKEVEQADVKGLLDRLAAPQEEPASSSWGSWGSWGSSLVSSTVSSLSSTVSSISADSVTNALNSIGSEAQSVLSDTLQDLGTLASKTAEKAASVASAVETALGLEEERTGFAAVFVQSGGLLLNTDLKELAQRAADAVASMELEEETEARLKKEVSSYRVEGQITDEDNSEKEDTIQSVSGVDVTSIIEAVKQHNVILVEAHAKLMQELRAVQGDDEKVAQAAVVNKNRMENLFSLGLMELLKRSFVLVSHQADVLTATHKEVSDAVESQTATAGPQPFRSVAKPVEQLRLLRAYLRQRLWTFQKNYAQMVRSLPELIEPFAESEDLVGAMKQLTQVAQTEIILDAETAQTILDNCFELLDYLLLLNATIKIHEEEEKKEEKKEDTQTE